MVQPSEFCRSYNLPPPPQVVLEKPLLSKVIKEIKEKIYHRLTGILDRGLEKIKPYFIDPPKLNKTPIYTVGSADPRIFVGPDTSRNLWRYCPTGVDTKITFTEEGSEEKENLTMVSGLSFIHWCSPSDCNTKGSGSLVVVVSYSSYSNENKCELQEPIQKLLGKIGRLTAISASEYGDIVTLFDEDVEFTLYRSGVGIDDIVLEGVYDFRILKEAVEDKDTLTDEDIEKAMEQGHKDKEQCFLDSQGYIPKG